MEHIKLNNQIKIPVVGIGTFLLSPKDAQQAIEKAVKAGKVKSIGISKLDKGTRYYVSSEETLEGYHAFAPDFDG